MGAWNDIQELIDLSQKIKTSRFRRISSPRPQALPSSKMQLVGSHYSPRNLELWHRHYLPSPRERRLPLWQDNAPTPPRHSKCHPRLRLPDRPQLLTPRHLLRPTLLHLQQLPTRRHSPSGKTTQTPALVRDPSVDSDWDQVSVLLDTLARPVALPPSATPQSPTLALL